MQNTGTILAIILVVVLAVLLVGGMGMMGFGGMMGGGMMGDYGLGFNPLGGILSLVFGALLIGGVVLLVVPLARNAGRSTSAGLSGDTPLDILKTRYAKGEITKEQLSEMKKDLGG